MFWLLDEFDEVLSDFEQIQIMVNLIDFDFFIDYEFKLYLWLKKFLKMDFMFQEEVKNSIKSVCDSI